MKVSTLVLVLFSVGCVGLLFVILVTPEAPVQSQSVTEQQHLHDLEQLMHIISTQNDTLYALKNAHQGHQGHHSKNAHQGHHSDQDTKHLFDVISSKDAEIIRLNEQLRLTQLALKDQPKSSEIIRTVEVAAAAPEDNKIFLDVPPSHMDDHCEPRFGLELIENWRRAEQTWCETDPGEKIESTLTCYPYKQAHKSDKDMFCEATNFVIDFSKVSGSHGSSKPPRGDQYLKFAKKSILSSCKKTSKFNARYFMPHSARQMRDFEGSADPSIYSQLIVQETPVYLLARDEDCENSFHSSADFMNMFLVLSILRIKPSDLQVMLYDKHTDGPYYELIKKAFSPKHPLLRHAEFSGAKVMFKKLVFHLESPAGLIFPKVSNPDPLRCRNTGLFDAYRKHILQSFDLWDVAAPPIPSITLSLRHRTKAKNVGRIMANEEEVVKAVKSVNVANVQVVDTAKMSFTEQLTLIRNTNVLIGIHGAGLMFIMFAAEEAILIEVHPTYRQDRHFRHAARMTGKIYMPVRATKRETCQGSSDNVFVPIEEFQKTLDGAVRIARNFDDGISECGAQCPYGVLGLDKRLNSHYKPPFNSKPLNTRFPCG